MKSIESISSSTSKEEFVSFLNERGRSFKMDEELLDFIRTDVFLLIKEMNRDDLVEFFRTKEGRELLVNIISSAFKARSLDMSEEEIQKFKDSCFEVKKFSLDIVSIFRLAPLYKGYMRDSKLFEGEDFTYDPVRLLCLALCTKGLSTKGMKRKSDLLYRFYSKCFVALGLIENNSFDTASSLCPEIIESCFKLLALYRNPRALARFEKLEALNREQNYKGGYNTDLVDEFKELYDNRVFKDGKLSISSYFEYGWVDEIDDFSKYMSARLKDPNKYYCIGSIYRYLFRKHGRRTNKNNYYKYELIAPLYNKYKELVKVSDNTECCSSKSSVPYIDYNEVISVIMIALHAVSSVTLRDKDFLFFEDINIDELLWKVGYQNRKQYLGIVNVMNLLK